MRNPFEGFFGGNENEARRKSLAQEIQDIDLELADVRVKVRETLDAQDTTGKDMTKRVKVDIKPGLVEKMVLLEKDLAAKKEELLSLDQ